MREAKKLILVGCGEQKRDEPCPAKDMYTSTLFAAARAYAEMHADYWYVLSARHPDEFGDTCGWIAPETVIKPYNRTLKGLGRDCIRQWVSWCQADFAGFCLEHPEHVRKPDDAESGHSQIVNLRVIILAGEMYVKPLRDTYSRMCGFRDLIETPLEGLQIGERIQWLQRRSGGGKSDRKQTREHGER